ncbi:MAG TPA: C4-type zinc ribbon domain-containing protein [Ignavibacteria bacterium]
MDDITPNEELETNIHNEPDGLSEPESNVIEYLTDRVKAKRINLKETLKLLYDLKNIDSELAEIEEEKGDLPGKIEDLKSDLSDVIISKEEKEEELNTLIEEETRISDENKTAEARIYKFDEEKYNVRNNKEYDKIVQMIDAIYESVGINESRLKEIEELKKNLNEKMTLFSEKLIEMENDLKENQALLAELDKEHEEEELELSEKRNKLLPGLSDIVRSLYEKINGTFRGEAVALVRKGNCSGCYNSIPPQREIEIKTGEDIFLCQSCGRILVDESLIQQ